MLHMYCKTACCFVGGAPFCYHGPRRVTNQTIRNTGEYGSNGAAILRAGNQEAYMHIPDNYLSPQTDAVMAVAMVPVWVHCIKKVRATLDREHMAFLGICAAFSFLLMMFNVPLPGGTTGHAVGGALIALSRSRWRCRRCYLATAAFCRLAPTALTWPLCCRLSLLSCFVRSTAVCTTRAGAPRFLPS